MEKVDLRKKERGGVYKRGRGQWEIANMYLGLANKGEGPPKTKNLKKS